MLVNLLLLWILSCIKGFDPHYFSQCKPYSKGRGLVTAVKIVYGLCEMLVSSRCLDGESQEGNGHILDGCATVM